MTGRRSAAGPVLFSTAVRTRSSPSRSAAPRAGPASTECPRISSSRPPSPRLIRQCQRAARTSRTPPRTATEDGRAWIVTYNIRLDAAWLTRAAHITARTASGLRQAGLTADGAGHWRVDGRPAAQLDGCLDIDLESSALTNTLPVHRLAL